MENFFVFLRTKYRFLNDKDLTTQTSALRCTRSQRNKDASRMLTNNHGGGGGGGKNGKTDETGL